MAMEDIDIIQLFFEQMGHALIPNDKITFSVSQLLSKKEHSNFRLTQIDTDKLLLMKPDEANAITLKSGATLTGYGIADGILLTRIREKRTQFVQYPDWTSRMKK